MVRLVPIENDVIPMLLLVNMYLIKRTLIIFPCDLDLAGYRAIPMVHWYQWYDWYQRANSYYEYSSFYKLITQNIFPLTQGRNTLIVIMNIPRSLS